MVSNGSYYAKVLLKRFDLKSLERLRHSISTIDSNINDLLHFRL